MRRTLGHIGTQLSSVRQGTREATPVHTYTTTPARHTTRQRDRCVAGRWHITTLCTPDQSFRRAGPSLTLEHGPQI
ncbi:hypothetical protein E2C01_083995 [Portunus trituberculatus]|uniref:Uncharacterized protein n=1 Tax=Portunus trituberculatus TaxID=210409 RepID=A0A5B7J6A1_PORTR|nr:hypothetical protein [Portunus trituberculatus]